MTKSTQWWLTGSAGLCSVALHAAGFGALGLAPPARHQGPAAVAQMTIATVMPKQKPIETPPPKPEPKVKPERTAARRTVQPVAATLPQPQSSEPEPPPPTAAPVDMTGVTLTGSGAGVAVSGNGADRSGPLLVRSAPRPVLARPSPQAAGPAQRGPALVPVSDLSRAPRPPTLNGLLKANYPASLKSAGISGVALVMVQISSSGVATSAQVASESHSGFGSACRRTVLGSRWSAPLDRAGRSVATRVRYRCRFRVEQ